MMEPLPNFAFNIKLRRYGTAEVEDDEEEEDEEGDVGGDVELDEVLWCWLTR